ncbi:aromatic acid exporter family protein [Pontibacillus salicampi]|uniref:Aromatic acid exporter family protein n=1 Tax=Pontibacillus salicampi TaxID=1449801 RepID=A0ABV6LNI2_9BACI
MVEALKKLKLFGSRTLKTGISVFATALICLLFDLPVIFAVVTAIVTIENTASDSIKKALVRFPASAIGAFLAATLYGLMGQTALTYALAAMLTIAVCHKLKLDDGIIVATLTAVAMIPEFNSNYFVSFFMRLGTTSIGIIVSSLVNFFLLPPDYSKMIYNNVKNLYHEAANVLEGSLPRCMNQNGNHAKQMQRAYRQLTFELEKTYQLSQFQREEWKYHRHSTREMKAFNFAQKKLNTLQQIVYHLGNLQYVKLEENAFTSEEKNLITSIISTMAEILRTPSHEMSDSYFQQIEELDKEFWHWKEEHIENPTKYRHHFPPQTIIIYELLSLHDVMEELRDISRERHQLIHIPS